MTPEQKAVREFHELIGAPIGDEANPQIVDAELRIELIREEFEEFAEAVRAGDLVAAVDALCDIQCVVLGAATAFGVDLEMPFAEVHLSNMQKGNGPVREDGKRLKPDGWQPPNIALVLSRQIELAVTRVGGGKR